MQPNDIAWRAVFVGYGVAVAGTLVAGGALLLATGNMWWLAGVGLVSLFLGGFYAGFKARTSEPLNGAFLAFLYFASFAVFIAGAEIAGMLPDPLPGLPRGDSTFFFVWPLGQLATATLGAVVGGWVHSRIHRPHIGK